MKIYRYLKFSVRKYLMDDLKESLLDGYSQCLLLKNPAVILPLLLLNLTKYERMSKNMKWKKWLSLPRNHVNCLQFQTIASSLISFCTSEKN